ncbi:unnamed protein product [Cylindrotheca closterium]|uniref:Separase n=1 Tax=Cylindrotheca closterium TaxID=2856 RepID=A0AAD2GA71_9STRA|nr:unnamed protein product [Cylindrotheca closterium]
MSWAAANAPKRRVQGDESSTRRSGKQGSTETVEAALARLSKGYTTAMECIGSVHKTNRLMLKEKDKGHGGALEVLMRVSRAARTTLEKALLTDLLVEEHTPCLHQEFVDMKHALVASTDGVRRPLPPALSSEAHKSTVRELAYLALVNYSDLLLSCGHTSAPPLKRTVLDNGVVRKVGSLGNESCWEDEESIETTQRLALAALCDASKLDGTDPILWLKLACAARQLQTTIAERNSSLVLASKYRRMQKYALESGTTALPSHMPPNRAIARARKELEEEEQQQMEQDYDAPLLLTEDEEPTQITLELPRYSWSIFGRMLVRVCREGTDYQANPHGPVVLKASPAFGSPALVVKLNPMFVLPPRLLRRICAFLDTRSTVRFEMTCRGISFSMMDAMASSFEDDDNRRKMSTIFRHDETEEKSTDGIENEIGSAAKGDGTNDVPMELSSDDKQEESKEKESSSSSKDKTQSSRTSKRLRSQQITSGKIAERQSNRKSFEYCFLAATMSCTKAEFKQQVQEAKKHEARSNGHGGWSNPALNSRGSQLDTNVLLEAKERTSAASLGAFVEQYGTQSCNPIDLLRKYLGHVAMNVHDVFVTDPRGPLELTSSVLTAFDLYINRTGSKQRLALLFFEPVERTGSFKASLELFALDLLYCELVLKRCERYAPTPVNFDEDCSIVARMVLPLLEAFDALEQSMERTQHLEENLLQTFFMLGIRSKWLGAGFYFWRRRISQVVFESREAEDEAVYYIDEANKAFESPTVKFAAVATPHLVSPGRTEAHWKEVKPNLLGKLRDDIQASSVVSHAKQRFQELVGSLHKANEQADATITETSASTLTSIGEDLFERYRESHGKSGAKHMELVEDFLLVHGEDLYTLINPAEHDDDDDPVADPIPVQTVSVGNLIQMSNPSILSILTTCFNVDNEHREHSIRLLAHVALTAKDLFDESLARSVQSQGGDNMDDSHSDDDSMMSDDDSRNMGTKTRNTDELRARQCGLFVIFLIRKIKTIFLTVMDNEERKECCMSSDCTSLLVCMFALLRDWTCGGGKRWLLPDDTSDQRLFLVIVQFMEALRCSAPADRCKELERFFFVGIARTMVAQSNSLLSRVNTQGSRTGRATRQKLCIKQAELLGLVLNELGHLLSGKLVTIEDLQIRPNEIISGGAESVEKDSLKRETILFCDAVLRLWRYGSLALSSDEQGEKSTSVCSSFDRPIVRSIQTPLIVAITGLCGSAIRTATEAHSDESGVDQLCLTDFYDSDASANEWLLDCEGPEASEIRQRMRLLLRVICHTVYCINIVMTVAGDKRAVSNMSLIESRHEYGPLLPLVATRVLNFFADSLLVYFGSGNDPASRSESLWAKEYPYTTRSTGEVLDVLLRRSYRWLFGFTLVGEKENTSSTTDNLARNLQPESTSAAARLYRCIVRTYPSGRRSPPKSALEVVSSALPPIEETEKSRSLKEFVFQSNGAETGTKSVLRLMEKAESWNRPFKKIKDLLDQEQEVSEITSVAAGASSTADEAYRVRRGISSELASGQVPANLADTGQKGKSDSSSEDERLLCLKHEEEASKKFLAIIDDICLGNANDTTSWYRAAQCVALKAELIADRLGLSKGYARSNDFSAPSQPRRLKKRLTLDVLEAEQKREDLKISQNWVTVLGQDLSVYVRHSWSSFSSLQACSDEIKKSLGDRGNLDKSQKTLEMVALKNLEKMNASQKFLEWQEAWGGIFVFALKKLALRLLCTALFMVESKEKVESDDKILNSEICEAIGVALYSQMMASQNYGYPMHTMSEDRKRSIAMVAKVAFERAANGIKEDESQETWDLTFMVGKCHEKIASTFKRETFTESTRLYEKHMSLAMSSYASALEQAKAIDEDGGHVISQQGGSSHGSTEVLYRIHASRLKCLISLASYDDDCMENAEVEALRLTEAHWYKVQDEAETTNAPLGKRDRIWNVVADVVAGLAQCRMDDHFFHRSVYRHAQALMWAPVLLDPASREGSLGMVQATKSHIVRGLNNSTHAAYSAEVVIRTLFDRKRAQLCAVWLTSDASNSPFQVLNSSNRKYDSLRGKYIGAYIEALRLCNRWSELEQFTKLLCHSKRDAANYFQASALEGGNPPSKSHANDCILYKKDSALMSKGFGISAKRQANSVFAELIMKKISDTDIEKGMEVESNLKQAYACFLRLHCSDDDIKRTSAIKYGVSSIKEVEALCQAFLETEHAKTVKTDSNDWSGGAQKKSVFDEALSKCRALFPTLSGNFLFKQSSKSKDKDSTSGGKKRKRPSESAESGDPTTKQFEISVPQELAAGDQFVTTISFGENVTKKVKLTVPKGNPKTLRFSLKIDD